MTKMLEGSITQVGGNTETHRYLLYVHELQDLSEEHFQQELEGRNPNGVLAYTSWMKAVERVQLAVPDELKISQNL